MYTIFTANGKFTINQCEVDEYRNFIKEYAQISGVLTDVFIVDLMCHEKVHGINLFQVFQSLKDEENGSSDSGLKKATQFKRRPLKGLWHRHYLSGRFILHNVRNENSTKKLHAIMSKITEGIDLSTLNDVERWKLSGEIAYGVVSKPFEKRRERQSLTGEWIVFAKYNGENYYLCLATHSQGDENIFKKINEFCLPECPFLNEIIENG